MEGKRFGKSLHGVCKEKLRGCVWYVLSIWAGEYFCMAWSVCACVYLLEGCMVAIQNFFTSLFQTGVDTDASGGRERGGGRERNQQEEHQ